MGKGHSVSDVIVNTRRWASYVCPSCRLIFRVPKGREGEGVLCPGCRLILKIPSPLDPVSELTVASTLAKESVPATVNKQRQRFKPGGSKNTSWDHQAETPVVGKSGRWQTRLLLLGGLSLLLLVAAGMLVSTQSGNQATTAGPEAVKPSAPVAPPTVVERSEASYLAEIEPIARKFMQATTVSEILPLVRNPAVAEPRMRQFYPDGKIAAPGISEFNTTGVLSTQGKILALGVRTRDREEKAFALIETPQGLKVDWESWVNWSEMPWSQFIATRPAVGHVYRVILSPVVYYNFDYSNDTKWKSYSLELPDHEHAIFGYVERGSEVDKLIHPDPEAKSSSLMLSLKFSPHSTSKNQVEIECLANEGWVEKADVP